MQKDQLKIYLLIIKMEIKKIRMINNLSELFVS